MPHTKYKSGRKNSKTYKFDKGTEIWANHHQALHSKLCTPKFFENPPPHPGLKPPDNKTNLHDVIQWNRMAEKFAEFYLSIFCPESNLYSKHQENNYSYEWEDPATFVTKLQQSKHIVINRF